MLAFWLGFLLAVVILAARDRWQRQKERDFWTYQDQRIWPSYRNPTRELN